LQTYSKINTSPRRPSGGSISLEKNNGGNKETDTKKEKYK